MPIIIDVILLDCIYLFFFFQEKEPLRIIPLKEVHKVQECKHRYKTECHAMPALRCYLSFLKSDFVILDSIYKKYK